jgi:hypothetical protein|tara:strand:- start:298 stop:498 length:201 start_codon:yes stop_codon:yes gene_type:complete
MVKYMTKKQVIADFNTSFSDLFHNMSEHELEHFWDMNLDLLLKNKKISKKQRSMWNFNKKDLELSN